MTYSKFNSLHELAEHLKSGGKLYYQAPLDARPAILRVNQLILNYEEPDRSRIHVQNSEGARYKFYLAEHLDRFRRKA